jgi:cation:H+ antiporter
MLLSIAAIVVGLALLVWSADRFVLGASATARDLGVSPLIVGLLVMGFATSAPEMLVAGFAATSGNPGLGIGNAMGSNIANIALILGGAALLRPLTSASTIITRELPLLIALTAAAVILLLDGALERLDGVILLLGLLGALAALLRQARRQQAGTDPLAAELSDQLPGAVALPWALFWLVLGFVLLLVSSRMLVWGSVNIALTLGVTDLVVGLTIVAVGTSLPEVAAAGASALKNEHDLVLGNVIGSNLFNTLAVLGLPALIEPGPVVNEVLTRDLPVMGALTLLLVPMLGRRGGGPGHIGRGAGLVLISCFLAYEGWLFATL